MKDEFEGMEIVQMDGGGQCLEPIERLTDGPYSAITKERKNMHYKNGREAKNGDKVILIPSYGPPKTGILYDAVAGNDACNGRLANTSPNDPIANLSECLHADDVAKATVPDSTIPAVTS